MAFVKPKAKPIGDLGKPYKSMTDTEKTLFDRLSQERTKVRDLRHDIKNLKEQRDQSARELTKAIDAILNAIALVYGEPTATEDAICRTLIFPAPVVGEVRPTVEKTDDGFYKISVKVTEDVMSK